MFTFKKSDFLRSLPISGTTYNCLSEFPAIMSLRSPAEFNNFKAFVNKLENADSLKSFHDLYFSLSTSEKHLFVSFVRLSLSEFSASAICANGHLMDDEFFSYFASLYDFFDSFLGDLTFYQTFRVLVISSCFLIFAAMNPKAFYFEPISENATFDKYSLPRFWFKFLPQLSDFYK